VKSKATWILAVACTILSVATPVVAQDWTTLASTSYDYCDFDVLLHSDSTWHWAFPDAFAISDIVESLPSVIQYFREGVALEDPFYVVPEHLTLSTEFTNMGTVPIESLRYRLFLRGRFGEVLHTLDPLLVTETIAPNQTVNAITHLVSTDYLANVLDDASEGLLGASAELLSISLATGFAYPRDCGGRGAIPDDGRLAHTETGTRVVLFQDGSWTYEADPAERGGTYVGLRAAQVSYFGPGRAADDFTFSVPAHARLEIELVNVSGVKMLGLHSTVLLFGHSAGIHGELYSASREVRDILEPNEVVTLTFPISSPSHDLISAIEQGSLTCYVSSNSIALEGAAELYGSSSIFDQALVAEVKENTGGRDEVNQ